MALKFRFHILNLNLNSGCTAVLAVISGRFLSSFVALFCINVYFTPILFKRLITLKPRIFKNYFQIANLAFVILLVATARLPAQTTSPALPYVLDMVFNNPGE